MNPIEVSNIHLLIAISRRVVCVCVVFFNLYLLLNHSVLSFPGHSLLLLTLP